MPELRHRHRRIQAEPTPVVGVGGIARWVCQFKQHIAQGLVGLDVYGLAHQGFGRQLLGPVVLSGKHQPLHFGQGLRRCRVVGVVAVAVPDAFLVELDPFVQHPPEHHRAQPPVAHRQGLHPAPLLKMVGVCEFGSLVAENGGLVGGPVEPKAHGFLLGETALGSQTKQQDNGFFHGNVVRGFRG